MLAIVSAASLTVRKCRSRIAAIRQHSKVWTVGDRGTLIVARWFAVRAGLVAGSAQPEPPRFDLGIRDVLQLGLDTDTEAESRWLVDLICGCSLFVSEGRAPWRAVSLTPV
jgi:hypothetical protein